MMIKKSTRSIVQGNLLQTALQSVKNIPDSGDPEADKAAKNRILLARRQLALIIGLPLLVLILALGAMAFIRLHPTDAPALQEDTLELQGQLLLAVPVEDSLLEELGSGDLLQFYAGDHVIPSMRYVEIHSAARGSVTVLVSQQQMLDYMAAQEGGTPVTPALVIHQDPDAAQDALKRQENWNNPDVTLILGQDDLALELEQTAQLELTVELSPAGSVQPKVTWSSSDEKVATVSQEGLVTAISPGKASIKASCDTRGVSLEVESFIAATELSFAAERTSVAVGAETSPELKASPEGFTETLKWSSSDPEIVQVSDSGAITGLKAGEATVTVTGVHASAQILVTVTTAAESVSLNRSELALTVGETGVLAAAVTPEDASDKTIAWTSSDEAVAVVDAEGTVVAVAPGEAVIKATCGSVAAECKVTVTVPATPGYPQAPAAS